MGNSIILKTEEELAREKIDFEELLKTIKHQEFWREHFERNNVKEEPSFSWDFWKSLPYLTKNEFSSGTRLRIRDALVDMKASIYNYLLRVTSGTTAGKPALMLHYISEAEKTIEDLNRGIRLWQPFHIGLRWTLTGILLNRNNNTNVNQFLVLDPYTLDIAMEQVLIDFHAQSINGLPSNIIKFADIFSANKKINSSIKKIIFGGDFASSAYFEASRKFFPHVDDSMQVSDYIMTECGRVGSYCGFLRKKYGNYAAYHPAVKNGLMEIVDPDEGGCGEIVISKIKPQVAALIRYKTGDVGRAVKEKCECGEEWGLIFLGRLNFDYIKCAGTLVTRVELERVCSELSDYILEWRAEVMEVLTRNDGLRGALKLRIKPTARFLRDSNRSTEELRQKIEKSLFLTPKKTMSYLVLEGKFESLLVVIVDGFKETQKKILLKKVDVFE